MTGIDSSPPAPATFPAFDDRLRPGDLGDIVAMHAREYRDIAGLGVQFEAMVARDLAEFALRDDPDSRIWVVRGANGAVAGSVAVDLSRGPDDAQLRWFLLRSSARGMGVGRRLLDGAIDHLDRHRVRATTLWTFAGLDAARSMYDRHGFVLVHEEVGARWGRTLTEQRLVRRGPVD